MKTIRHFITNLSISFSILFMLCLPVADLRADTEVVKVNSDIGICAHPNEVEFNTGGKSIVRIKGNEHYYLFNFDTDAIRGWDIKSATLHIKVAKGNIRKVAICTVPAAWVEGTGSGSSQAGSTCFTHRIYPKTLWSQDNDGTLRSVTFNSPYSYWETVEVKKSAKKGWIEIPISKRLIQCVTSGLSHGLLLSEEKGQSMENHDIYTREQAGSEPYISVRGEKLKAKPVKASRPKPKISKLKKQTDFEITPLVLDTSLKGTKPLGSIIECQWKTGRGKEQKTFSRKFVTTGDPKVFLHGLPMFVPIGVRVTSWVDDLKSMRATFSIRNTNQNKNGIWGGKAYKAQAFNPVGEAKGWKWQFSDTCSMITAGVSAPAEDAPKTIPVPISPRNAWVSMQLTLFPPNSKAGELTYKVSPLQNQQKRYRSSFIKDIQISRIWHVWTKDEQPKPEVLVPLAPKQQFAIPWKKNGVNGQNNQSFFIDIWVPSSTKPGVYKTNLQILQQDKVVLNIPLSLTITKTTLPNKFNIVGDMNTYSSPARAMGLAPDNPEKFIKIEQEYYRLAHQHRMTLNVLPYDQAGNIHWAAAPKLGKDYSLDWEMWDKRYGPLLTGQAFSPRAGYIGPGESTPLHHMYLPFHENWPVQLADRFRPWPPPKDYNKLLLWLADLAPIEKCLTDLKPEWKSVASSIANHFSKKRYTRTQFQFYVNNKYYFRKNGGRGISLWLLDEPMHPDDFLAIRHFCKLMNDSLADVKTKQLRKLFSTRIDISRPGFQRNWLDGHVGLNVCAGQLFKYRKHIAYRKFKFGEEYWNYKMPASFQLDNRPWMLWPIKSLCWGATGTLPWQTIGSDGDLNDADPTALMYPGVKFKLEKPLPSLRMKAWREGLQIAELLNMLKVKKKLSTPQLRMFVASICFPDALNPEKKLKEDSMLVTFEELPEDKLDLLKRTTLKLLDGK